MQLKRSMVALALFAGACGTLEAGGGDEQAAASSELALQWTVAELGPGGEVAIALDRAGNPALAIRRGLAQPQEMDGDTTPVLVSNDGNWRRGAGWSRADVAPIAGMVDGAATALAFGTGAQVAFNSRVRLDRDSGMVLKLATQSSVAAGWQVTTVESTPWVWQLSQRYDAGTGTTFLGYATSAQTGVTVARSSVTGSGGWTKVALPGVPRDLLTSMEIAIVPANASTREDAIVGLVTSTLSATSSTPRGIHYTSSSDAGATWRAVAHIDTTGAAIGPMLAYAGKNPVISYSILDAHLAKLATSSDGGATWRVETIGTFGGTPATGLAVDSNGDPLVAIIVANSALSRSELHLARRDKTTGWSLELVDTIAWATGGQFAVNPRIAVTSDRRVVIGYEYHGTSTSFVRFAWSSAL